MNFQSRVWLFIPYVGRYTTILSRLFECFIIIMLLKHVCLYSTRVGNIYCSAYESNPFLDSHDSIHVRYGTLNEPHRIDSTIRITMFQFHHGEKGNEQRLAAALFPFHIQAIRTLGTFLFKQIVFLMDNLRLNQLISMFRWCVSCIYRIYQ